MARIMHWWTDDEVEFLKNNYQTNGSKYCADYLNIDISKVQSKIECLKLKREALWTEEKLQFLKDNYYKGTAACVDYLQFTPKQIRNKAKLLRLFVSKESIKQNAAKCCLTQIVSKINVSNLWLDEDIKIMEQYYPQFGSNICAEKLNNKFSLKQIRKKCNELMIYKDKILWTAEEIRILETYYHENGSELCAKKLNNKFTHEQIRRKCEKLKLKISKNCRSKISIARGIRIDKNKLYSEYKVNPTPFINIDRKEIAYILGMLWADGYIMQKGYRINLELQIEDMEKIKHLFFLFGAWRYYERQPPNRKKQGSLLTTNKVLYNLLCEFDYHNKSVESAHKIINYIPKDLQHYWWQGYFDGDGTLYINKKHYSNQMSFCGSYLQNWTFAENLMKELNITNYKIVRRLTDKGNSSIVRITNRLDICKISQYFYGENHDCIGFKRKYDKFQQVINKIK